MIDLTAQERLPKVSTDLPLTPMIDVVFLLLIFFVSIQFKRIAGMLETRLPRTEGIVNRLDIRERLIDRHIRVSIRPVKGWKDEFAVRSKTEAARELQRVTVEIDSRDLLRGMKNVDARTVTNDRLFEILFVRLVREKNVKETFGKVPVVVLDLHPELTFQNVVSAVNAAKRARFANISFLPPSGGTS